MSPYYQRLRASVGTDLLMIPAVAAVIHDEAGRLLLQEKHDGSWSLPAGAIEPGERPEAAIEREVLEETGLQCVSSKVLSVLGGSEFRYTYSNGDFVEYVVILFHCVVSPDSDAYSDRDETRSIRYFSRNEFPGLELPYDINFLFSPSPQAEQADAGSRTSGD
ncbi:MAG: NUDIX domain-containing protein [Verrucomicrobiaceae bacterium]|nr:MAG: NUDIX domain-containing protein [Verrucomicrobiaceae bacterium]